MTGELSASDHRRIRVADAVQVERALLRKPNWQELLCEYIEAATKREFSYGAFDCALFCADWVQIATGVDYAAQLRGYDSMLDAYRIIARYGSMQKMVTQLLAKVPVRGSLAQCGDIVSIRDHPALGAAPEALGICVGVHSAFPAKKGCSMIRTHEAPLAWRID